VSSAYLDEKFAKNARPKPVKPLAGASKSSVKEVDRLGRGDI
jgi:hypothetical protein